MTLANKCHIGMKWRIKEDVVKNALVMKEPHKSDMFNVAKISDVQYYLTMKIDDTHLMIYLNLDNKSITKIVATFTIAIKSASLKTDFENCVFVNVSGWGGKFCNTYYIFDQQNMFFDDDGYMEIELEGILKPEGGFTQEVAKPLSLTQLLWDMDDKDITILTNDHQKLMAHKWILCARSSVFKSAFNTESKENRENLIDIIDFSYDTVKLVLEYFYERNITNFVNESNACELLHFADKYDIQPLLDLLQNILIGMLTEANVVMFANMSITSNAHTLRECCICFLINSVGKFAHVEDVLKLKSEITSEICRRSFPSTSE
uniref:BTB domain-containing protein n=1 Tax=Panagrolaimus sp. ES5 TaxID=591445 RepID=A0AC34FKF1_9BILA